MKPYYKDDYVTIYHGDCLNMEEGDVPRRSIDLVLTDPPYSVGTNSSGKKPSVGDFSLIKPFFRQLGRLIFAKVTKAGAIYLCTDWRTYPILFECLSPERPLTNLIVWDYGWIKAGKHYRFRHEFVMFWAMDGHVLSDKATPDVWNIGPINFTVDKNHPSEKPVELMGTMIEKSGGRTVLDPFLGSGTTALAAKARGIRCIGYEIEERYCEIAANRCRQMVMELGL